MSSRARVWTVLGLTVALVGGAFWWVQASEQEEITAAAQAREARRREREAEEQEQWGRVADESDALVPPMLEGIQLGMSIDRARRARPAMEPNVVQRDPDEPDLVHYEERFENGARAVYVFEQDPDRLQRIQVLSMLPSGDAIAPHLMAMNEQYGTPTGVWDCPQTGGVPTRRFTWRHGQVTVVDIFLVYGGRVSQTLYIAPTPVIGRSLVRSRCHPVPADQIATFPAADPSQLQPDGP